MKKSKDLIPLIIAADTEEKAIDALTSTVEVLHLSQNYYHLVDLEDQMKVFESRFKEISSRLRGLPTPRKYEDLKEIRYELNFLHQELVDDLAFEINKSKIYWEENKTRVRAESMIELKNDKEFQATLKATSTSALRDVVGQSPTYKEYINMAAISYGSYQEFSKLIDSIKLLTDSVASEARNAMHIEQKNVN